LQGLHGPGPLRATRTWRRDPSRSTSSSTAGSCSSIYIHTYIHMYIHAYVYIYTRDIYLYTYASTYICIYTHTHTRARAHTHTSGDLRIRGAFLEQLGQREVANVAICKVHGHRTPLAHGYSLHLAFEVRELEQALFCGRLHKRRVLCVCVRACVRAYTSHVQIHLYLKHCARNMRVRLRTKQINI
jgi:precorrin-4 methylase